MVGDVGRRFSRSGAELEDGLSRGLGDYIKAGETKGKGAGGLGWQKTVS